MRNSDGEKVSRVTPQTIDNYIAGFSVAEQKRLRQLRETIAKAAPNAEEAIKYGIPTFVLSGNLVHFGGFKHHLSFFPTSSPIRAFKSELSRYHVSKGTIQFPWAERLPLGLIRAMVKFRVREALARAAAKSRKKA